MAVDTEGNLEGFLAFKKAKESTQKGDEDDATTQDADATNDTIAQDDETETTDDDSTEDVQDEDTDQDEEADSDEEEGDDDTETAPGEDETEDEDTRLDAETVKELARAYADELLTTEELQERISKAVEEQVRKRDVERQDAARAEAEVADLIQRGKTAIDGMFSMLNAAHTQLGSVGQKDGWEENFDPSVLDADEFNQHLNDYGMAIVGEVKGRYHRALDRTVIETLQELPTLSQEQASEISTILQTAKRMEGDQAQAPQVAYYVTNSLVRFLLKQARESAIAEERARVDSRKTVAKKVADPVAVKAAAAKLAKQKGKTPPNAPPGAKSETDGIASGETLEDAYDRLKKAGKTAEAQALVDRIARRGAAALSR